MSRSHVFAMISSAVELSWFSFLDVASAQDVPTSLTHQGRLLDDNGAPISGSVELLYTIYDTATDGAVLWQDFAEVDIDDTGFYSIELGSSGNPIDADVLADGSAWIGVSINGGDELLALEKGIAERFGGSTARFDSAISPKSSCSTTPIIVPKVQWPTESSTATPPSSWSSSPTILMKNMASIISRSKSSARPSNHKR